MREEQRDTTVDGGLVDSVEPVLQAEKRECFIARKHLSQNHDAHGSGTDVALLKHGDNVLLAVHD